MSNNSGFYVDEAVTPMFKITNRDIGLNDQGTGYTGIIRYAGNTICTHYPHLCIVNLYGACDIPTMGVQLINCAGKGMTPFYKFDGIEGSRFNVPIIPRGSNPTASTNKNCHKIRGPNNEVPPPELLWKSKEGNVMDGVNNLPAGEGNGGSCGAMVFCGGKVGGDNMCSGMFLISENNLAPNQICEQPYMPPDPDKIYPNTTRR